MAGIGLPAGVVAHEPGIDLDPPNPVVDRQGRGVAGDAEDAPVELGRGDHVLRQQFAVQRHAFEIALQPVELDLEPPVGLLDAGPPATRHVVFPQRHFRRHPTIRQQAFIRRLRTFHRQVEVAAPVRRGQGQARGTDQHVQRIDDPQLLLAGIEFDGIEPVLHHGRQDVAMQQKGGEQKDRVQPLGLAIQQPVDLPGPGIQAGAGAIPQRGFLQGFGAEVVDGRFAAPARVAAPALERVERQLTPVGGAPIAGGPFRVRQRRRGGRRERAGLRRAADRQAGHQRRQRPPEPARPPPHGRHGLSGPPGAAPGPRRRGRELTPVADFHQPPFGGHHHVAAGAGLIADIGQDIADGAIFGHDSDRREGR